MKKFVLFIVVFLIFFSLVGKAIEGSSDDREVLNVFNWGEYIGEDVISNFEREYNVKVNYTTYSSNEMLYAKLNSEGSYDVIFPGDYMLERLIKENKLEPLDYSIITNTQDLDDEAIKLRDVVDMNGTYTIPYLLSSVGIAYDKNKVSIEELEEKGYEILKDPKYKGDIFIYDSERDCFAIALKTLGYSANSKDEKEISEANKWLEEIHMTMDPSYVTDEVIDAMYCEEKPLALMYSGDAAYITSMNDNIGFYIPKEGTRIIFDGFAIPKTAGNKELANKFINYMLKYETAYENSLYVGYTGSNSKVKEELTSKYETYENNEAYLFDISNPNNEMLHDNGDIREMLSEYWIRIKCE